MVEKGKGRGEYREMVGYDSSTNFDDGELLGRDGAEVGEVLLNLSLGADVTQ